MLPPKRVQSPQHLKKKGNIPKASQVLIVIGTPAVVVVAAVVIVEATSTAYAGADAASLVIVSAAAFGASVDSDVVILFWHRQSCFISFQV